MKAISFTAVVFAAITAIPQMGFATSTTIATIKNESGQTAKVGSLSVAPDSAKQSLVIPVTSSGLTISTASESCIIHERSNSLYIHCNGQGDQYYRYWAQAGSNRVLVVNAAGYLSLSAR